MLAVLWAAKQTINIIRTVQKALLWPKTSYRALKSVSWFGLWMCGRNALSSFVISSYRALKSVSWFGLWMCGRNNKYICKPINM